MPRGRSRGQAIHRYKLLATFQAILGSGLIICGVAGTMTLSRENDVQAFVPPYFIGGYAVGILQLLAAMIAGCVAKKAADDHISPVKKRRIGCCIYSHYIVSMLTTLACFVGLIFAGVFGVGYESSLHPDLATTNRRVAIAIIFGSICALLSIIMSMYLVCTSGRELGGVVASSYGARMVITLSTGSSNAVSNMGDGAATATAAMRHSTTTGGGGDGFVNTMTIIRGNQSYGHGHGQGQGQGHDQQQHEEAQHVAELKAQNRLLQRQLRQHRLQQQELLAQQRQLRRQHHRTITHPTPPPAYSFVAEDQGVTLDPVTPITTLAPVSGVPPPQPRPAFTSPPPAYSR